MDTVFEDYLAYSAGVRHFSEKTIEAYRNDLKLFSDWLADNELSFTKVTRTQVRIFVADLGNRHFAPASINRTLSCVRGLYRYALQKGLCTTNPAAVVRNLKQPDKLPRFLFPDEAERFCEFPKEAGILWYARDAAIFSSLYSTGCRAAELQGLKITDLKGDCSWAIVQGKGSKERKVFFADFAREAVQRYLTERAELIAYLKEQDGLKTPVAEDALFLNCRGGALTTDAARFPAQLCLDVHHPWSGHTSRTGTAGTQQYHNHPTVYTHHSSTAPRAVPQSPSARIDIAYLFCGKYSKTV